MRTKKRKGGKVLGSGGYGCIFKPVLKCKNKKRQEKEKEGYVTKLMKTKNTEKEFAYISKYKKLLSEIPNYADYYLIDGFSICKPDILTEADIEKFDKKCSALKKMGLTSKNVNSPGSLDKLMSLNMPYGGIDVGDYIRQVNLDYEKMTTLNNSLIKLLTNGILPMNSKNVFHCDIKEANILVLEKNTRLIDWGLSTTYDGEKKVPNPLYNRPFQYNVPFSVVLFNDMFAKMYAEFLKKNPNPSFFIIRAFVVNYVIAWVEKRGLGHLHTLNDTFKMFFEKNLHNIEDKFKDDLIEFDFTFYFIFEYISQILFKYTKNNKFDVMEYFSEVFLKNLDVWGFTMTYIPIAEYLYMNYDKLSPPEILLLNKIKDVILFIIESSTVPI